MMLIKHTQEIGIGVTSRLRLYTMIFVPAALLMVFTQAGPAFSASKEVYKIQKPVKPPAKADKSKAEAEQPKAPVKPEYVYNPEGKTDPFKSFIADQEEMEEVRKKKPRTYLETLSLSQLDLIAIIESPKGNWAMVRDGKGIGYSIRKGTAIGTHDGVVEQINGKEIVIKEKHRDIQGKMKIKRVRKELITMQ